MQADTAEGDQSDEGRKTIESTLNSKPEKWGEGTGGTEAPKATEARFADPVLPLTTLLLFIHTVEVVTAPASWTTWDGHIAAVSSSALSVSGICPGAPLPVS